jgi:uncharacterized protein YecE (DUF72 family)
MAQAAAVTWTPYPVPPDITPRGFYVGTSGYYFDDWLGLFNPPKTNRPATPQERDDQDRLRFYQKYFSFVEINNTFYTVPVTANFVDIERRSKQSMKYAVKVYRDISHTKTWDVTAAKELMRQHVAAVSPLVETGRFFSFLIQLEDHLYRSQKRLDYLLAAAAEAVGMRIDVHIEFRHISWHTRFVLQALKDAGVGVCNTGIPAVAHAFPLKYYATTDKGYVRYSGRNLANWYPQRTQNTSRERLDARNARYDYLYSAQELDDHVKGQLVLAAKTTSSAIAYNNHYQTKAVLNAIDNISKLREKLSEGV